MKIKDLDREQIYDLRGITNEQATLLLQWLMNNDKEWHINHFKGLINERTLYYYNSKKQWCIDYFGGIANPTTHISTLFEPSYEEQLIEALERVETLKAKIKEQKLTQL